MSLLFSRYHSFFTEGIRNTLIISAFSVLIATILGTLLAMLRMSRILPLRLIATAYIEFIRDISLLSVFIVIRDDDPALQLRQIRDLALKTFYGFRVGIV